MGDWGTMMATQDVSECDAESIQYPNDILTGFNVTFNSKNCFTPTPRNLIYARHFNFIVNYKLF